jgi:hypothetical protein
LRSRRDIEDAQARVEEEFTRERAVALRRIGERLGELSAELARRRAATEGLGGRDRQRAREAYDTLRREARLYRWYLEVQREAVGVRGHRSLDEIYPPPEPLDP